MGSRAHVGEQCHLKVALKSLPRAGLWPKTHCDRSPRSVRRESPQYTDVEADIS